MEGDRWRRLGAALLGAAVLLLAVCSTADARQLHEAVTPLDKVLSRYFTNQELVAHMRDFSRRCSAIARMQLIGHSVRKFPLYVLEISDKTGVEEAEPHFKYIANMHGDETGGRQLLLALAEWLCANYKTHPAAKRMVNNMHLWLMPTMNPDGYADGFRENANFADLNRDFPDPFTNPIMAPTGSEQPETKAVMAWSLSRQFTASANMHEGSLVVNYPWDGTRSGLSFYNVTPDNPTFIHLSKLYVQKNPALKTPEFPTGITNGAAWYTIYGGMQDWNYIKAKCFEVTLELCMQKGGCDPRSQFNENLNALLAYALRSSLGGLRGTIKEQGTGAPLAATITVNGSRTVTTTGRRFGDFYRPLVPGKYTATIKLAGASRAVKTLPFTVPTNGSGARLDVTFP